VVKLVIVVHDDGSRAEERQFRDFHRRFVFNQWDVNRTAGWDDGFRAFIGRNANVFIISQHALLAKAAGHALARAPTLIAGAGACGRASGAAGFENFVGRAFRFFGHGGEDHVDWGALSDRYAFAFVVTYVTLFATASRAAHTIADGHTVRATAIASTACTEFFIVFAMHRRQQHLVGGHLVGHDGVGALMGGHAITAGMSQETGFAETADDAVFRAHWAGMRIVTGWMAR